MIRQNLTCKKFFLAVVLSFFVFSLIAADRYSIATGRWDQTSTWSTTSGGPGGASVPGAGDNVYIEGGYSVRISNAAATCANLSISAGSTLDARGQNLTVGGTTIVNGTLSFTQNAGGTKTFTGLVTVNGSWTNTINSPVYFRGGISNNGTFTAGTGTYTFNTNNQTISGTFSISAITVTGVVLTNNATLTVTASLGGTGGITQGVNAQLNIGGSSPIATLTASNSGNTVNFSGANQSVNSSSYYNLTISGSGNKTLTGNTSVDGTLTLTAGTLTVGANQITLNGPAIAGTPANLATSNSSSLSLGGSSAGVFVPSSVANLNNLTINNINGVTLNSNIILASGGVLTLSNGILQAGTNTLRVSNTNPSSAIVWTSGSFINVTTGSLERVLAPNLTGTGNNYLFPIGEGDVFKGINLRDVNTGSTGPVLKASVSATGALTGDGITIGAVDPRCWSLINTNGGNFTSARIELYESDLDATKIIGMSAAVAGNYSGIGGSIEPLSILSPVVFNPGPYFCIGTLLNTYYSYQTGDWNITETWTTDPSGTLQIGSTVPGTNDKVVILTGRTVSLSDDVTTSGLDISIDEGGFLDQTSRRFTNALSAIRGKGTLKLASVNFPSATINTFVDPGGGTTEYNNPVNFILPASQNIYNNLTINTSGSVATQLGNLTLNGNLYIKTGTIKINDNTSTAKLILSINGNVTVDNGAFISVGNGVTNTAIGGTGGTAPFLNYYTNFHTVIIKGDFTNNGTVNFTNLPYPVYNAFPPTVAGATSGAASVYFQGAHDNNLICNGITNFYNLIIDKGTDQTYKLNVNSTSYSNFRLSGANTLEVDGGTVTGNPDVRKALWIRNGTLVLTGQLIIPSLTEGTTGASDYYIPSNGALIIEGVDVAILSTADNYQEINAGYSVSAPDNATIGITTGGASALVIFGKLQIDEGYLSTRESAGIITSSAASGQVVINGGTLDAKQFLSATGSASYTQSGGLLILRGRFRRIPVSYATVADITDVTTATLNTTRAISSTNAGYGTFNLENTGNIYAVSGGTICIYDVTGTGAAEQKAFDVKSSSANINVTNGTLEIVPVTGTGQPDPASYLIFSNAPLGNLSVNRISSTAVVRLSTQLDVLNDLSLISGDLASNNLDISIGGDFLVENGTTYTAGSNTTTLNGTGDQIFTYNPGLPLSLSKLTIDKPAGKKVTLTGSQNVLNVTDNFRLVLGTFDLGSKTMNVSRDVYNSGVFTGTGKITLNGTLAQTIDGAGIFENIELNNTNASPAPVTLSANMTINGALTLSQDKLFNIGTYNLLLNSSASVVNVGSSRYVQTAGNAGDGGLTRVYSSSSMSFTFPVGAPTITPLRAVKYTPATIGFSASPSVFGSVTVIPVGYEHPATTINGQSLTYFWRIKSAGFTGIAPGTVTHSFIYDQNDVAGTEINYIPSLYNRTSYTWNNGLSANINTTTNTISDWATPTNSTDFLDGDYTAGDACFGVPIIYYSRQSGIWSTLATWSLTGHTVDNPPATSPGANDIVIIGDNDSIYLSNEIPPLPVNDNNPAGSYYQRNKAVASCATLQIEAGSVLDVQNNPGCNFGSVITHPNGNGKIRLTTRDASNFDSPEPFVYPGGDYSEFNTNSGISEFYTINPQSGTYFILPSNANSYGTVILTPLRGSNIILPNIPSLTIYGDLICNGSDADAWLAMTWIGEYGIIVEKTVYVKGDLRVLGGAFGWYQNVNTAQNIIVDGDVIVGQFSCIDDWGGANNQSISIGGSLINDANGLLNGVSTRAWCRFTNIPVTFFGNNSSSIANTTGTPSTTFGHVTVNKGDSQTTTLNCNIAGTLTTPNDNWLTLVNGTFIYNRTGNFNISRGTDFIIPSTSGLTINTPSNVYIANIAANNKTLYLNGRLTILNGGGNVYIGPAGNTANNADIEYAGSGASALEVQGGNLFVTGQIRRALATTNGILSYGQSGGNVVIYGNNASAAKAKLEIINEGSAFTMTGGTITIVRGGGTTYGDLYLRPTTSSVTGGTILFTQTPVSGPVIDANQTYLADASISLNNLTITGKTAATQRDASLTLMISPLVLNGALTISNGRSTLNSNNLNISIKGDLNNSGTYNYGTNLTTFNGGTQNISGSSVTDFYDLTVSPLTSLTVNNSFSIYRNLTISSGILVLTDNLAVVLGNLINNGSYTDNNTTGGISLNGTLQQQVSGTGSFGRLEISNSSGARLNNDITLQNNLVMNLGILDINIFQLTLGQNSLINGAPFGVTKMIRSDGVTSCFGVRKFFTASPQTFTFPVGVAGKYTPVIYTILASSTVGSIKVNPIDNYHPSVTDPPNVLKYYWQIESAGISGFNANVVTEYMQEDVFGTESDYVAARLEQPGNYWYEALPGPSTDNVDETNNQITFTFTSASNLNGDYTAGNNLAIPGEVPTYQSNKNGNWSDVSIWTPVNTIIPCPSGGPSGAFVIVDHIVTIDINRVSPYSTLINDKLRVVNPTFGHNLGYVSGNGTIYLEAGNLPGGNYSGFTDCSGNGTIEYGGSGTYTIIATQFNSLPNMLFTGTGSRILPSKDLTICKSLVIDGPLLDNGVNNRKLIINGSIERYNSGAFASGTGASPASTVSFAGSSVQTIGGPTGDFAGDNKFNNLEINNPAGIILGTGSLTEINNELLLTNGIITTGSSNSLVLLNTSSSVVLPEGGTSSSFVNGPLIKQIVNGDTFLYPIGKGLIKGHNLTLTSSAGSTIPWTAEFFTPNPTSAFLTSPLVVANSQEYWSLYTNSGSRAKIKLGWDPTSDLTPLMTENGLPDMRVAEYISGSWNELASTASGDINTGDVITDNKINISTIPLNFTIASVAPARARASFTSGAPVCGTAGIPVSFTSSNPISLNYTLDYTIDGVPQPTVDITSLPYTLPTSVPGSYQLTAFTYNNGLNTGVVNGNVVNVYAEPTIASAGPDQPLCGVSGTILAGNDPAPYNGLWTVISGSGGTIINSTEYNSIFTGVLGESYTLRWTISNVTCTSSDDVVVSFPVAASIPSNFISAPTQVFQGSGGYVYTVLNVPGNTYNWTYSGTGQTIIGTGNSVTIDFGPDATSGTLSVTASNSCGTSLPRTVDITVSTLTWTGAVSTDWNSADNWSGNLIPILTMPALIPDVPNKPVLSTGAAGTVNNLTITSGSSLTIAGNTFQISGSISNNGTLDATDGTIEMNGLSAQVIGSSVFSGNTIKNLTISNSSGVSLQGPLNVTGIVRIQSGNLVSDGFLTLASSASATALVDGSGTGSISGNVVMQRYLPSAFGYRYLSSSFQSATVNEFGDEIDLAASFPLFYRYNESSTTSGWVTYTTSTDPLNPMEGYAGNFGSSAVPLIADITGVVNNGPLSITLYNNNNTYTKGFNLIGNPYPSPIDWIAPSGWTKTNIDNALYYFKASPTDEFGGKYSTWVNGVSSDDTVSNIIPSMQGFFIHITDGPPWPVTGSLTLNNDARITDLTHIFAKSGEKNPVSLLRLGATFGDNPDSTDPTVIYFDEKASSGFDGQLDALKLMNTDYYIPSFYSIGTDGKKLSINALPESPENLCTIPLGLKSYIDGYIVFRIIDSGEELSGKRIYITDVASDTEYDLLDNKEYRVYLKAGEYKDRFYLNLSSVATEIPETGSDESFTVYSLNGIIKTFANTAQISDGVLTVYNLAGQVLFVERNIEAGYNEFNPGLKDGIYIVTFTSGNYRVSKKVIIQN